MATSYLTAILIAILNKMNLGLASDVTFELTAKKQRRKAQGIYYTPRFVTSYIVKETVGRFLQEHSYDEVLKMRVLDMACGSGSFLIRAYDELLNYHADKRSKAVSELDQYERLPVLTGNIYGVDLDMQAVEIARLNLLLRSLARRELLPSLAANIRQGNALISGADDELRAYFGETWRGKQPFDWEREFPQIMGAGGFDVIIGNPPYFNIETLGKQSPDAQWIKAHFSEVWMDKSDILFYFITRAIMLLRNRVGFIVSRAFLEADKAEHLRQFILDQCAIETIIDFRNFPVFTDASIATAIIILRREPNAERRSDTRTRVAQIHISEGDSNQLMQAVELQLSKSGEYLGNL